MTAIMVIVPREPVQEIVAGGRERILAQVEDRIRAEVRSEYLGRLSKAGFWKRIRLRYEMWREIRQRIDEKAPPGGLYARSEGDR